MADELHLNGGKALQIMGLMLTAGGSNGDVTITEDDDGEGTAVLKAKALANQSKMINLARLGGMNLDEGYAVANGEQVVIEQGWGSGEVMNELAITQLNDQFTTDKAAGAVNDTSAEPGPGTRKVTDAESKLSISSAKLTVSGGKASPAIGDPGYWLTEPITRIAGVSLSTLMTIADVTSRVEIGFDDSSMAGEIVSGYRINADTVKPFDSNVLGPTIYTPSDATLYGFAVVARPNGNFYFMKVGEEWRLIWQENTWSYNNNPIYAGVANHAAAFTADDFKLVNGIIVQPLLSDKFKRDDGSLGNSDGYATMEGGGSGKTWNGSTWSIASQRIKNTPTLGVEKLTDGGLEANYTDGKCDTLAKTGSPTLTQSADVHGGSKAQEFTAAAQWDRLDFANIIPTAGTWYEVSGWAKRTAGTGGGTHVGYFQVVNGGLSTSVTSADWEQKRIQFLSLSINAVTAYAAQNRATSGFDTIIVDDFSVKPLVTAELFANPGDLEHADILASANLWVENQGNWAGLACCMDSFTDPQNYLLAVYGWDLTTVRLYQVIGSTVTLLTSGTPSFSGSGNNKLGCEMKLIKDGTKVRVYLNNVQMGTEQTISETIKDNTKFATFSSDPNNQIDNVVVYPVSNSYSPDEAAVAEVEKKLIICDGDSLTANANEPLLINKYYYQLWGLLGEDDYLIHSMGVGGQTAVAMNADAETNIDNLFDAYSGGNIIVAWAGTNDLAVGTTPANTYAALSSYVSGRQTAGFKVILLTMIKRGTNAALETARGELNALINANTAGADAIVDVGSDAAFSDVTDTTYYDADQIHLTHVGYGIVAGLVQTAIEALEE